MKFAFPFYILLFSILLLQSCFLFKDYRKKEFIYSTDGQTSSLPIIVPKGYVKEERKDSGGITVQTFSYGDGAVLYAAYLTDTTYELQPIDKTIHQPLFHRLGGLVYKGQDRNDLYYREIRRGAFRFGYQNVPEVFETQFDSATNYASLQKR